MHVALLANTAWLDEQLPLLQQLLVGLMDERMRVTQVVPDDIALEGPGLFGQRVDWTESRWPLLNAHAISRLSGPLAEAGIDIVHALDGRMWRGAIRLGTKLDVPVVLSANSYLDVKLLSRLRRRIYPARTAFAAATEPLAQAMREKLDSAVVLETVQAGVYVSKQEQQWSAEKDTFCVTVSGNGRLDARYQSLLYGMAAVIRDYPQAHFFFDGQEAEQHQIWSLANRLGLLSNMSLVPRRLGHRELLMRSNILIHPQALGRSRSLSLYAMAHAIPIFAESDPWVDYLIDDVTAQLVDEPTADQWEERLCHAFEHPGQGRALGQRAQQWLRENRPASRQIERVIDLYRRMTGESLHFPE